MQKRSAAALINRHEVCRCITRVLSLVLCFAAAFSMTAASSWAQAGAFDVPYSATFLTASGNADALRFVDVYELDLEDGSEQRISFSFPRFNYDVTVDNTVSMDVVVKRVNAIVSNYDYTVIYDTASGQLIAVDADNNNVEMKLLANGKALTIRPSSGSSDGLSVLLEALDTVIGLMNSVWELMTGNPLLTLFLAVSLLIIGVRAFRQIKFAATGRKGAL